MVVKKASVVRRTAWRAGRPSRWGHGKAKRQVAVGQAGDRHRSGRRRPTPHGGGGGHEEQPAGERHRYHWGYGIDGSHRRNRCFGPGAWRNRS